LIDVLYPFGILKLFYLKIPKGSLTEIKFLFWYKCPNWYLTLSLKIKGHHLTNDINERWQIRSFILLLYVCNNRCLSFGPFFLLTIVFFVLRFTDSDYPFGILKLFYLKILKGSLTEIKFLFWYLSLYVTCWAVGT
jgi:hypothetical protein